MHSVITRDLQHLVTQGTYHDFLNFVEGTNDDPFQYLFEISQGLLSLSKEVMLPFDAIDICGTGGDSSNIKTTNISTISAFVLASMGVPVAKHGGRSVSSSSGSVDFLEALHIPDIESLESIKKYNICFLKAQNYHDSFRYIAPFRKQYGKKTIFNLLGPLINPANITHQMIGVSFPQKNMVEYATVLQKLGRKNFAIMQSDNTFDELLSFKSNIICYIKSDKIAIEEIDMKLFNFQKFNFEDPNNAIFGKTPQENAKNLLKFFANPEKNVLCETIALNCGVASWVFGKCSNIAEGVEYAKEVIFSKKPLELIHKMQSHY